MTILDMDILAPRKRDDNVVTKPDEMIRLYAHVIPHYNRAKNSLIIWAFSDEQILHYHAKQKQPCPPYEYELITDYWDDSPLKGYDPHGTYHDWFDKQFESSKAKPENFKQYKDYSKTIFIDRNGSVYVNGEYSTRINKTVDTNNGGRHFL